MKLKTWRLAGAGLDWVWEAKGPHKPSSGAGMRGALGPHIITKAGAGTGWVWGNAGPSAGGPSSNILISKRSSRASKSRGNSNQTPNVQHLSIIAKTGA